jgi:hypothetical protein
MRLRGRVAFIPQCQRCRGGGVHGGRRGLRLPPAASRQCHGEEEKQRQERKCWLTVGAHMAAREEVEDGPAVRWAERARWAAAW